MNTHAETLEKIYNMLQEDTIQLPKSLMAYDDIDENTKIMFSIILDECIKGRWQREGGGKEERDIRLAENQTVLKLYITRVSKSVSLTCKLSL